MYFQKIFENKIKFSWYPFQRMMNLKFSLVFYVINKCYEIPRFYLYKEYKELFSNGWNAEYEKLKKEIPLITKLRKEKSLIIYPIN